MKFDVVIGNPPYNADGFGSGFYCKFILSALCLSDRFVSFIHPNRWMTSDNALEVESRHKLKNKIRTLVDFIPENFDINSIGFFKGAHIRGGVSYYLADKLYDGDIDYIESKSGLRCNKKLTDYGLLRGVNQELLYDGLSVFDSMSSYVIPDPFKIASNDSRVKNKPQYEDDIPCMMVDDIQYISNQYVNVNKELINKYKVAVSYSGRTYHRKYDRFYGKILPPGTVCSGSYVLVYASDNEEYCKRCVKYLCSSLVVMLKDDVSVQISKTRSTWKYVPMLDFSDDDLIDWDAEPALFDILLFKLMGLTDDEIETLKNRGYLMYEG